MIFFFKNKTITLDCYTANPFAYEYAKIAPAPDYYPEWWQNIPPTLELTVRHCRGFVRLYKNAFVIPMWGTLAIDVDNAEVKSYKWESSYPKSQGSDDCVTSHSSAQFPGYLNENYRNIKISSPWFFKTNRFVEFYVGDNVWNRDQLNSYTVLPGVMDFKYQSETNVNLMVEHKKEAYSFRFNTGDPLLTLIPLTEEKIKLKCHLVDDRDLHRYIPTKSLPNTNTLIPGGFTKKYYNNKTLIQALDKRIKSKCPFGF